MFSVVYLFDVKDDRDEEFIQSWEAMTLLIAEYEGGLGSRLHKTMDGKYYAYAQWPDEATWEQAGSKLPSEANAYRNTMRACCKSISTEHKFNVVKDLLK